MAVTPKKLALKNMTRMKGITPRFKGIQALNRVQASPRYKVQHGSVPGMGTHTDMNNQSVQRPATTLSTQPGTTVGSNLPQAPDQASVTKQVLSRRAAKPPRATEQDYNPFPHKQPPGSVNKDRRLYMNAFKRQNRKRGGFR